jgi:radical SAM protein with 4Fe4S-binding SPASM domain
MKNIQNLAADIAEKRMDAVSFPILVFLESVKGCPFSCVMCDFHDTKPQEISPDLLDKITPFFKYLDTLCIHGNGEPLLSKNLDFYIASAVENNFRLGMNTTGMLLNHAMTDKLLEARLDIWFSIHAGRSETYRKIMGGDLDRVMGNIAYLTERDSAAGSSKNSLGLSYIVFKENIDEIEDFLILTNKAGIKRVRFQELIPKPNIVRGEIREKSGFTFNYFEQYNSRILKQFVEKLPRIRELARELNIEVFSAFIEHKAGKLRSIKDKINLRSRNKIFPLLKKKGNCLAPWAGEAFIEQDGRVTLCCSSDYVLGNLNHESFDEIWNSDKMIAIRKEFQKGNFPRICGYCPGRSFDNYSDRLRTEYQNIKK